MNLIRVLPENVVNQIAAGEVIQRPSSIIKELMENSIDAGAHTVDVFIEDGGRSLVQVIDDGKGMDENDARMAFMPHATSKISQADDLFSLSTMGFRGEALPSIAAVSQVVLETRTPDSELGTHVEVQANEITDSHACVCPPGTNFSARNLFFNIPVRRKFLKSNSSETGDVIQKFQRVALVYPSVEFSLTVDGRLSAKLQPTNLRRRIVDVFGKGIREKLIAVEAETSLVHISGFVGRPESSRQKGAHQFFFVNGRYFQHGYFSKAVQTAFEGLIPAGEKVPYFLYFDIAPSNVDVNISPTKTEVKFENEPALWQIVLAAVKEALGKFNATPSINFEEARNIDIPTFDNVVQTEAPQLHFDSGYNPFKKTEAARPYSEYRPQTLVDGWQELYNGVVKETSEPVLEIGEHHYQFKGQYIITATDTGLLVVDQHRAHVRVLYERYMREMNAHSTASQRLMFPELLHLGLAESGIMDSILPDMHSLGFDIENLGGGSYSINGVPAGLDGLNVVNLVRDMVESVVSETAVKPDSSLYRKDIAMTLARKSAIVRGQLLDNGEMDTLLKSLFECENPNQTPNGKAIISTIPQVDIDRMFN